MLPSSQSVAREQLPPLDTSASLCVSFEDTLGFTRPLFRRSELRRLPGSSLGILKDRPSVVLTVCVHSRRTGARGCQLSSAFRPCRSSRLRRFTPHAASRVYCTPQPTMGSAWFRADRRQRRRPTLLTGATPLEAFPSAAAVFLVTGNRSPLSPRLLPSRRLRHRAPKSSTLPRPQGFLRRRVRCSRPVLPRADSPMLPWAFS
jgi:hypothetical protein